MTELAYSLLGAVAMVAPDFLWFILALHFKFQVVSSLEAIAISLVSLCLFHDLLDGCLLLYGSL